MVSGIFHLPKKAVSLLVILPVPAVNMQYGQPGVGGISLQPGQIRAAEQQTVGLCRQGGKGKSADRRQPSSAQFIGCLLYTSDAADE